MRITHSSQSEEARLNDLYAYDILDTDSEKDFDELVELVATIYNCPSAAITFIDQERLWIKAAKNVAIKELPRNESFCTHTIQGELMVVNDTYLDSRFATNKLATQEYGVRFYAGASIISSAGSHLGSVCVFDGQPRPLTTEQFSALRTVANQVSKLLELRAANRALKMQAKADKKLTFSVLREQEKERYSISCELHENIAQGLAAAKLYLDVAAQKVEHPFIESASQTVTTLLHQVKELTHTIVPTTLQSTPFKNLLQILARRYQQRHGLPVVLTYDGPDSLRRELSFAVYRMVEEAVENVRLHAKAGEVLVKVSIDNDLKVIITDDGIGINTQQLRKGHGLNSIVSVTEYYGGTADLSSDGKQGCVLTLQIPLN